MAGRPSTEPALARHFGYTCRMPQLIETVKAALHDRIQWMTVLVVLCFVSVLLLSSQSAASYSTYILALLMLIYASQWKDVFKVDLVRWVLALLIWLSLSAFWSEPFELRSAASVWIRALLVFCFVVAFAECQLRGQLQRWMGAALTIVGGVAVVAAIINFYVTVPLDGRLNGLGQLHTHVIAALVNGVILLFVLQFAFDEKRSFARVLYAVIASIIVFAIIMSDSRNAWVAVALGTVVFSLSRWVSDPRQFVMCVLAGAILLGVGLFAAVSMEAGRELMMPRGLSFRPTIWSGTLDRLLDGSVLFGLGVVTSDDIVADGLTFQHPHNMYLSVLFQGGVVGLGLYLIVIYKTLANLLRHYHEPVSKLALAILAISLTAHLLDGHELVEKVGDVWFLIWLPVAISIGLMWRPAK